MKELKEQDGNDCGATRRRRKEGRRSTVTTRMRGAT